MELKKPAVAGGIPVTSIFWKALGLDDLEGLLQQKRFYEYIAGEDCINLENNTGEEMYWEKKVLAEGMHVLQSHLLISMP